MKKFLLNGLWQMRQGKEAPLTGKIPGSVYSILLENEKMEDPFYRANELDALQRMEDDFVFTRTFTLDESWAKMPQILLRCEGLDTVCTVTMNGTPVGYGENMFRTWEWDVSGALQSGENTLQVHIASPTRIIRERDAQNHVGATGDAMRGFSHLRKAHCMFGWDWGPRLPDAGIWRDIMLLGIDGPRIGDVRVHQRHVRGQVFLTIHGQAEGEGIWNAALTSPDGAVVPVPVNEEFCAENPQLWWPNGLGKGSHLRYVSVSYIIPQLFSLNQNKKPPLRMV